MKKLFYLFSIIAVAVAFSACSSDPDNLPASKRGTATKTATIIAAAGNQTQTDIVFELKDFAALEDLVKYVKSGTIQTSSSMKVSGISGDIELTNVALTMASNSKNSYKLDDITENKVYEGFDELKFLEHVVDELVKKGNSKVILSYKATNNITTPVTFAISLDVEFKF